MAPASANTRKPLSQNFLTDAGAAGLSVRASGITAEDLVLEIGPGDGMLTRRLLKTRGRVQAYEKDSRHAALLRRRSANSVVSPRFPHRAPAVRTVRGGGRRRRSSWARAGVGGSVAASLRREFPARAVRGACRAAGISLEQPVGWSPPIAG